MIKINNFRRVNSGCKKATCDVEMPNIGFKIAGMSLIESNGRSWADYPKGCRDEDGQKKYHSHCEFTDSKRNEEFKKLVFEEMTKFYDVPETQKPQELQQDDELPF